MAPTAPSTRTSRGKAEASGEAPVRRSLLQHPMGLYYLLLGATLALLGLGLLMVLSASSVLSIRLHGSPYTLAQRQLLFAAIGVVLMVVATRLSVRTWRRLAGPALIVALVLLVAVLIVGVEVSGQRNWIDIVGPFRLQPSEFAKIALILWSADTLARKEPMLDRWSHLLVPVLPVTAMILLLVLLEGDVGNTLILAVIACGVLFAAGAPLRLFALLGGIGLLGILALTLAALVPLAPVAAVAEVAPATLTVTGEGVTDVVPDMATLTMGVTTTGTTAAEALSANSTALAAVLDRLRATFLSDARTAGRPPSIEV